MIHPDTLTRAFTMRLIFAFAASVALFATTGAAIPQAESSSTTVSFTLATSIHAGTQASAATENQPTCVIVTVSGPETTLGGTTAPIPSTNVLTTSVPTTSVTEQTSSLSTDTALASAVLNVRQNTVLSGTSVTSVATTSTPLTITGTITTVSTAVTGNSSACTVTVTVPASNLTASGPRTSATTPPPVTRVSIVTSSAFTTPSSPRASGTSIIFNSAPSIDVSVRGIFMTLFAGIVAAIL
ncbi:hypothetical protein H2248_004198 [Termitomyces sp. 'cryptogamus']|nr:hypothetical protein H2248_004198 [Termitomyces sp. 'cryptogamus']